MGKLVSEEIYQLAQTRGGAGDGSYDQEEIRNWLRIHDKILVLVSPIDSWNCWKYTILMEDCMSPFFDATKDPFNEFPTYEDALEEGLKAALETI